MKRTGFFLIAAALAGCGGSSDGGGLAPINPPADLAIDSSNGQFVARATYLAALQSGDMAGLVGNSGLVSSSDGGFNKPGARNALSKPLAAAVSSIPFGPETLPCDVSGSITVSGNLADPTTLSAGDVINIDADNCNDGLGETTDGVIGFTVDAISGDFLSALYDLTMSLDITNFQVTTAEDVLTTNGDTTVRLNTLNTPAVLASVSGLSLTADSNTQSRTLTNYLTEQTLDAGQTPSPYTMDSSGTLNSSELGGVVDYATEVIFQGFDNDYPSSGELLVSGDNSSVRLTAIDNVNVQVDIDNNGDDVIDETIVTTWDALVN